MAYAKSDSDMIQELHDKLLWENKDREKYKSYYFGHPQINALGMTIPPELMKLKTVINWNRQHVNSIDQRLDIEGFRLAKSAEADETLWDIWQYNNLDEGSQQAHREALIYGSAYVCVGHNEEDSSMPIITVEPASSMTVEVDPRTRRVRRALRVYRLDKWDTQITHATLYTENETRYFMRGRGGGAGWVPDPEIEDDAHNLGVCPVVPIYNNQPLGEFVGKSEMDDLIPIVDAAARAMTNLQGALELHALPQRYVAGADASEYVDENGNPIPAFQVYLGRIWNFSDPETKVGQFQAGDLRQFNDVLNQYAQIASSLTGQPPHFFGLSTDSPPSADAIRSSESRLVKLAERKASAFSEAWEKVMRLALKMSGGAKKSATAQDVETENNRETQEKPSQDRTAAQQNRGSLSDPKAQEKVSPTAEREKRAQKRPTDDEATRLEVIWRNPATPTFEAKSDAITKLVQAKIMPVQIAWEELGYGPEKRAQMADLMENDPLEKMLKQAELDKLDAEAKIASENAPKDPTNPGKAPGASTAANNQKTSGSSTKKTPKTSQ